MNLRELIDACREDIGDTKKPYLVSDRRMTRYANRSENDAARRARLLVDSSTPEICEVEVSAADPLVELNPKIISIRRAGLSTSSVRLAKRTVRQMDDEFPGWRNSTSRSTPFILITDFGTNQGYLYPTPKVSGTLQLTVTREPLRLMADDKDTPEIPERCHDGIVDGMRYLCYIADDVDLYDPTKAAKAQTAFTAEFGPPISAMDEKFEAEHYDDVGER